MPLTLPKLFESLQDQLPDELKDLVDVATELNETVDRGHYKALDSADDKLEIDNGKVEIFDQEFKVTGRLAADLLVHDKHASVPILAFVDPKTKEPVFDEVETLTAPTDHVLSELKVQAGAGIEGAFAPPLQGGFALSVNAAASGGIVYRHLLPSPKTDTRLEALTDLLVSSRPPATVFLRKIAEGELHVLETAFNLDLGLKGKFGDSVQLETDLADLLDVFDGLSAEIAVHAQFALEASLGFSLYQRMQLGVGRFNVSESDWVRLRLQRLHRRELTLGAKLQLQARYDLAKKTLTGLFDRILELDPTERLADTLREVQKLREAGGWEAVKELLEKKLGAEVDEFLEATDWRDWLSENDQAKIDGLLDDLQKIVKQWDGLGEKIRSFWGSLLGSADLRLGAPLVGTLRKIASLDTGKPEEVLEELLGSGQNQTVSLLETFSGRSIDELLVGPLSEVESAFGAAKKLASVALGFLEGVPDRAIGLIQKFAQRTGIEGSIKWLGANATSLDDLKSKADERIKGLVSRLLGKAFNQISDEDLDKLSQFLNRMEAILKNKEEWEAKIKGVLNRLEGELGFSISIEMGRLTERFALLDLEFDPQKKRLCKSVQRALIRGDGRTLLEELPEADTVEQTGYRIRDAVFTSRRVRTSALSVFLTFLGQRSRESRRVDEETIRVTQTNGSLKRVGSYAGGSVRTLSASPHEGLAQKSELGAWVTFKAEGSGGNLAAPYQDGVTEEGVRLTFVRKDDKTLAPELVALDQLLRDCGFVVPGSPELEETLALGPDDSLTTDFSFDLRLPGSAIDALLEGVGDALWENDYLLAAHRWFDEQLLPGTHRNTGIREGRILAALIQRPEFLQNWHDSLHFKNEVRDLEITIQPENREVNVPVTRPTSSGSGERVILLPGLLPLIESRPRALKAFGKARDGRRELGATPVSSALRDLAKQLSTAFSGTAFSAGLIPSGRWPNVLFNVWLVLARVSHLAPAKLAEARGLAVAKWKRTPEEDWQGPLRWQLSEIPRLADTAVAAKESDIFHRSLECPAARQINPANVVRGAEARAGRRPHHGCHEE